MLIQEQAVEIRVLARQGMGISEIARRLDLAAGYERAPKYLQAEKALAVEHYLEHGRCLTATIKALGNPARGSLSAWI